MIGRSGHAEGAQGCCSVHRLRVGCRVERGAGRGCMLLDPATPEALRSPTYNFAPLFYFHPRITIHNPCTTPVSHFFNHYCSVVGGLAARFFRERHSSTWSGRCSTHRLAPRCACSLRGRAHGVPVLLQHVWTASSDKTIKILNAQTGAPLKTLAGLNNK